MLSILLWLFSFIEGPERRLATENAKLLTEVDTLKEKLAILEARNGCKYDQLVNLQIPKQ